MFIWLCFFKGTGCINEMLDHVFIVQRRTQKVKNEIVDYNL